MDAEAFKRYFETNESKHNSKDTCTIIGIQGRLHPVEMFYSVDPVADYIKYAIQTAFEIHRREEAGDILIFVPGQEDIDIIIKELEERSGDLDRKCRQMLILPMHGNLPYKNQMAVFQATPFTHRKIVVSTNVSETSITIPGIVYVIDTMFAKIPLYIIIIIFIYLYL